MADLTPVQTRTDFPNTLLERVHCECGKCIGECDMTRAHVERYWCRGCKTWTVVVVR